MRNKLQLMLRFKVWLGIAFSIPIILLVGYAIYVSIDANSLIGRKVRIDNKELTITTIDQGTVVLSDRTRISVWYAKELLIKKK